MQESFLYLNMKMLSILQVILIHSLSSPSDETTKQARIAKASNIQFIFNSFRRVSKYMAVYYVSSIFGHKVRG
jgi:hypothetical protein